MIKEEKFLLGHPDTMSYEGYKQDQVKVDPALCLKMRGGLEYLRFHYTQVEKSFCFRRY